MSLYWCGRFKLGYSNSSPIFQKNPASWCGKIFLWDIPVYPIIFHTPVQSLWQSKNGIWDMPYPIQPLWHGCVKFNHVSFLENVPNVCVYTIVFPKPICFFSLLASQIYTLTRFHYFYLYIRTYINITMWTYMYSIDIIRLLLSIGKRNRRYHTKSPPPFLGEFGCRVNISLCSKYFKNAISR